MDLKPGVKIGGISPELVLAIVVVSEIFRQNNASPFMVTSVTDGKHSEKSLHYRGLAIDVRTRHLTDWKQREIVSMVKIALGLDFDVVLEDDHLHIEFDPKET